jgi:ABC-type lipoprotein export system ATPase subunit
VISGRVTLDGVDLSTVSRQGLRATRATLGVVYQDPATSLDPLRTVGQSIDEPLTIHRAPGSPNPNARVAELLESVQLPRDYRHRRPSELSGGQRQTGALARALALEPALLIADEPTSALDVSVQATILDLLVELQTGHGFACVFISHDLARRARCRRPRGRDAPRRGRRAGHLSAGAAAASQRLHSPTRPRGAGARPGGATGQTAGRSRGMTERSDIDAVSVSPRNTPERHGTSTRPGAKNCSCDVHVTTVRWERKPNGSHRAVRLLLIGSIDHRHVRIAVMTFSARCWCPGRLTAQQLS